jgi:MFS transporter, ACS family, hexuronate transporter
LSASGLGYAISQIPTGVVVDAVGARGPIGIGALVAGVSMLGIFFAPSYTTLLGLMFVTGIGCGCLAPSTTQAVVVWFPQRERATVMGLKMTAVNIGGMISAATLPTIAARFGWRYGFLCLGLVALSVGVVSVALYREPPGGRSSASGRSDDGVRLIEILQNRNVWLVGMGGLCLNWIELAMIGHVVLYLRSLQYNVVTAGALLAGIEGAGALARPISGILSDRVFAGRRSPVFMLFTAAATASCTLLGLAGPQLGWLLYPVLFVLGIGGIGFGGVFLTLLSEFGGPRGAGKAAALGSTVSVAGSIIGPPAFGYVADVSGSYQLAWLSLAIVGCVGFALLMLVRESERKL